jgi:putative tricarboxylic transport membrane protein
MKKYKVPTAPLILAVVVGSSMEQNFRMALMLADGDFGVFFRNGICWTLFFLAIGSIAWPFLSSRIKLPWNRS